MFDQGLLPSSDCNHNTGTYRVAILFCRVYFLWILWMILDPQKYIPAEKKIENCKNLLP